MSMLPLLESFLGVVSTRHQLIVSNMANIDTPGYHTQDVDFRAELHRAMNSGADKLSPAVDSVPGLLQRPHGNDVNLARLLAGRDPDAIPDRRQLMKSEFHRLLSAINEGK